MRLTPFHISYMALHIYTYNIYANPAHIFVLFDSRSSPDKHLLVTCCPWRKVSITNTSSYLYVGVVSTGWSWQTNSVPKESGSGAQFYCADGDLYEDNTNKKSSCVHLKNSGGQTAMELEVNVDMTGKQRCTTHTHTELLPIRTTSRYRGYISSKSATHCFHFSRSFRPLASSLPA